MTDCMRIVDPEHRTRYHSRESDQHESTGSFEFPPAAVEPRGGTGATWEKMSDRRQRSGTALHRNLTGAVTPFRLIAL